MPKRKRDSTDEAGGRLHKSLQVQQKRVEEKLFHSKKVLQRALKVAKGFERQKLGRRQKTAVQQKNEADKIRIDEEIEALKNLDLPTCAEAHLCKSFLRQKDVSSSPILPSLVKDYMAPLRDNATTNVSARLYNSNPVKLAMRDVGSTMRAALGLDTGSQSKHVGQEKQTQRKKEMPDSRKASSIHSMHVDMDESDLESDDSGSWSPMKTEEEASNSSDAISHRTEMVVESGNEDFNELDARVAGSSDEDDEAPSFTRASSDEAKSSENELSDAESSSSRSSSPPLKDVTKMRPRQSNFLPSLTMGGYVSGSESEAEDNIEELGAPRKNRRGQRARQAIWEKKFGAGAKHVQQEKAKNDRFASREARDAGWDTKRGAQAGNAKASGSYKPRWQQDREARRKEGEDAASGGNASEIGPRRKAEASNVAKPMHPSWEAAKKAKERSQDASSFTGKKIAFD